MLGVFDVANFLLTLFVSGDLCPPEIYELSPSCRETNLQMERMNGQHITQTQSH